MKLSTAFIALTTLASAAAKKISADTAKKLVRSSRRVEENAQQENDMSFLGYYDVKVVGCKRELEQPIVNEQGQYEYEAVLLRLCPSEAGCDSSSSKGCKSGYGDMLVGLSTFVESYFEDQRDNMQWDDAFQVDKFAKCEQYKPEKGEGDDAANWDEYTFFIGPTCSEDGLGIKLELFTDEYCTQTSEIEFETISNGWALPYSEGGLVSTQCNACTEYNDNGELELREMCTRSYENAAMKCETGMEFYSYYGQNVEGCDTIAAAFPMKKSGGSGGKVFGWIVLVCVVAGLAGYIVWWRKKKASASAAE
jgi:hypothetical protein